MSQTETFTLTATRRERVGTRHARRLRSAGRLPGVLYGHGQTPVPITLEAKETLRLLHDGERVFNMALEGATETALVKDVQFDYLGTNIVHVDFARVDLDEEVEVDLRIRLVGDAKGLITAGAILDHPATSIRVSCRVDQILEHLDVNIEHLDVGETLHAREVKLPAGFTLLSEPEDALAGIQMMKEEEEEAPEEGEAVGAGEEPEVISAKKEEDKGDSEKSDDKG